LSWIAGKVGKDEAVALDDFAECDFDGLRKDWRG
jgi:hypothetical protein